MQMVDKINCAPCGSNPSYRNEPDKTQLIVDESDDAKSDNLNQVQSKILMNLRSSRRRRNTYTYDLYSWLKLDQIMGCESPPHYLIQI